MGTCAFQSKGPDRQLVKKYRSRKYPEVVVEAIKMEFDNVEDVMEFIKMPKDAYYESDGAVFLGDPAAVIFTGKDSGLGMLLGTCTWHYILKDMDEKYTRISNAAFEQVYELMGDSSKG